MNSEYGYQKGSAESESSALDQILVGIFMLFGMGVLMYNTLPIFGN